MMMEIRIIISGGGTGGHIFPAVAIAGELRKRIPGCSVLFVGAQGRMEMEKVPAAGYPIIGLPVIGYPRKPGPGTFRFFFKLAISMIRALRIVRQFSPHLAIGVGGYASGPLLRAALWQKIPVLIQEQNSYAGITNKWLGKKATVICVAYEGMEKYFPSGKIVLTGNPVRDSSMAGTSRREALDHFNFQAESRTVLITGGSLGARSLNEAVISNLEIIRESGIQVIWQTGPVYAREIREKWGDNLPPTIRVLDFIERMDYAYAAADLVVARAGAGTISELCIAGKPVILVPSPNVAEDHQTRNAHALVVKGAAVVVPDAEVREKLFPVLLGLFEDTGRMASLSQNIRNLAMPDAAARIVGEALKLIHR